VNIAGVVPLAAGAGMIGWALGGHYRAAPDKSWAVGQATPEYLLTSGPYRFSRNPMYVGGLAVWTGWTLLFGSRRVARGLAVLASGLRLAIAWEEGVLEERWGDDWRQYAARSSRWLGLPPPG
jgi:protein-S-isoprenylcysteine O-methyltransferase Ste14